MSALALTLDDGPDAVTTPRLLDLLGAHGARATFFPMAERAAAHPELIARMLSEHHTVGVHCTAHERHSEHDAQWGRRDADRSLSVLTALGARPGLWRTPWGDRAPWTAQVAAERGLRLVGWDVDTHDWRGDTAAEMWTATCERLHPGAIVLAHDGIGPGARRRHGAETIAYAARLIAHADQHGLELEAL
ncbi:MAG TPA: polysaccharide deacetylase family protein [Solirubrobacteraceae bacterium]|nr:polysaccharide deacetylase family protein [Solirubrobacteraceae bacterium]